ncbi:hypothetical protein AMEJIAPC_02643 [Caulobacter sp. NIBR1757]|nr:hypothetical protein AMEJIAPC_02643 [Caulobacter sp. NIBR1757]
MGDGVKITSMTAAGAAVSLLLAAGPAASQAQIGIMIAQMQSERANANCEANRRPGESQRINITNAINGLMRKLHAPAMPPTDLAKLFSKAKGSKVANVTQLISHTDLRTELTAGPPGQWKSFVVGGDHRAARGVWRIALPGVEGGPETVREFGFDFVLEGGAWKVMHAQEYPGPLYAPEPDPFCHAATASSY